MLKWLWIAFFVIALDQITKLMVANSMQLYQSMQLLNFFNLTYVHNTGAAFSFLSEGGGWQRWFFAGLAIVMSAVMTLWLGQLKENQTLLAVSLSLILGGAIGNLIDRLAYGYVIDFLDLYYHSWHWPAFNIADSGITIGVGLMLIDSFFSKIEEK